jgi:hypothetical protein
MTTKLGDLDTALIVRALIDEGMNCNRRGETETTKILMSLAHAISNALAAHNAARTPDENVEQP